MSRSKPKLVYTKSVWLVTSVDETTGRFTVRPVGSGSDSDASRVFLQGEWDTMVPPRVGTLVRSHVVVEPYAPRWKLEAWLRAIRQDLPATHGMTLRRLRSALEGRGDQLDRWLDGTWTAVELNTILEIASRAQGAVSQAHWIYVDDWRWSREETKAAFERLLELPPNAVPPHPLEKDEPISLYAERCNEAAVSHDCERRLFLIGPHGDDHAFAALTPNEFERLVWQGIVAPRI